MLLNKERTKKHIVDFIRQYCKDNGKKGLVLNASESDINSHILIQLCLSTNLQTFALIPEKESIQYDGLNVLQHRAATGDELSPWNKYAQLTQVAENINGIIVSSITKELYQARLYRKGCVGDLLPMADLFHSEAIKLFDMEKGSSELFTTDELEWAWREDDTFGVITSEEDPTKSREWGRMTVKQRRLVAKLNQREKLTKHKKVDIPICRVRTTPGLVR